jgi:hypothetical protein
MRSLSAYREDGGVGPNGTRSDYAVWGSAIKGIY